MAFDLSILAQPLAPESNPNDWNNLNRSIVQAGNIVQRSQQQDITNERNVRLDAQSKKTSDATIRAANDQVRRNGKESQMEDWTRFVGGLTASANDIAGTEAQFRQRISSLDKQINEQLKTSPDIPQSLRINKDHTLGLFKQFREDPEQYGRSLAAEDATLTRMNQLKAIDGDPSSLVDKLTQMGLTPGTKEWRDMATQLSTQSKAPVVTTNVDLGSGLKKGYDWKDPEDHSQGAGFVIGGSEDPEVIAAKNTALKQSTAAADTAVASFNAVDGIRENIYNLNQGLAELANGANTGPIAQFFPTLYNSTQRLMNVQKRLGLDVVGGVTFGALSAGELKLALDVALPVGLSEEALKVWMTDKIDAQTKLAGYFEEQGVFLSKAGNTQADWQEKIRKMDTDPRIELGEVRLTEDEEAELKALELKYGG
jgi:hypothetical protein